MHSRRSAGKRRLVAHRRLRRSWTIGSHKGSTCSRADPNYPESLAERLPERWLPYMFFYRGNLHLLERPAVFVSGPSHPAGMANATIAALARDLASLPVSHCGTYAQGIERLMLDTAAAEHAATILILPVGLSHAGPILRLGEEAVERGERLELSPFTPETTYSYSG